MMRQTMFGQVYIAGAWDCGSGPVGDLKIGTPSSEETNALWTSLEVRDNGNIDRGKPADASGPHQQREGQWWKRKRRGDVNQGMMH